MEMSLLLPFVSVNVCESVEILPDENTDSQLFVSVTHEKKTKAPLFAETLMRHTMPYFPSKKTEI